MRHSVKLAVSIMVLYCILVWVVCPVYVNACGGCGEAECDAEYVGGGEGQGSLDNLRDYTNFC